jgi:hypothetical protein
VSDEQRPKNWGVILLGEEFVRVRSTKVVRDASPTEELKIIYEDLCDRLDDIYRRRAGLPPKVKAKKGIA